MKYLQEYRDSDIIKSLVEEIKKETKNYSSRINLMEVCGTHTMAIGKFGIRKLLPENINLLSGPGCPVCVTPNVYLDKAIAYSELEDVIIATFGDMIKVPGSYSTLEREKGNGACVEVVYSPLDALRTAEENPSKKVIFLGVVF